MAKKAKIPGSGRKKGSINKRTKLAADFVAKVEAHLRKKDKTLTLERISAELLTCGIPAVIGREIQSLREYQYGRPTQLSEISGLNGGPVEVRWISHVERPQRQAPGKETHQ